MSNSAISSELRLENSNLSGKAGARERSDVRSTNKKPAAANRGGLGKYLADLSGGDAA